ncbi:MAG: aspartate/glutamate racemase family protein [Moraxellaceae bacterium]|nr:aspartate/glutamate racemase family protein [Moraxellaceae bacterium]
MTGTNRTRRIALINPNASAAVTAMMLGIARRAVPADAQGRLTLEGFSASEGPPLITDEAALADAAAAMPARVTAIAAEGFDGFIIAGFGDPGLLAVRQQLAQPVTGIAEAGMAEAASGGRRFAIVTTTTALHDSLIRTAHDYGHADALAAVRITPGDVHAVMNDPARMAEALLACCEQAVRLDGAEAIVLGGGPLASVAEGIGARIGVPLVEPVAAAVRLAWQRCREGAGRVARAD